MYQLTVYSTEQDEKSSEVYAYTVDSYYELDKLLVKIKKTHKKILTEKSFIQVSKLPIKEKVH